MTVEQYVELLKYIQENNSWGNNMYENGAERHRILIKYVRSCLDTRDNRVWLVKFDAGNNEEISFRVENDEDLKAVYAFLDKDVRKEK